MTATRGHNLRAGRGSRLCSAAGAPGIVYIGVLKVLERERVQRDGIAGSSMGGVYINDMNNGRVDKVNKE